jgi:hypothetical protein
MSLSRKKILVFLLLTFAFSSIYYFLIIRSGTISAYTLGLMWCPGAAGLFTQLGLPDICSPATACLCCMGWSFTVSSG